MGAQWASWLIPCCLIAVSELLGLLLRSCGLLWNSHHRHVRVPLRSSSAAPASTRSGYCSMHGTCTYYCRETGGTGRSPPGVTCRQGREREEKGKDKVKMDGTCSRQCTIHNSELLACTDILLHKAETASLPTIAGRTSLHRAVACMSLVRRTFRNPEMQSCTGCTTVI